MTTNWKTKIKSSEFKIMRLQETAPLVSATDSPEKVDSYLRPLIANSPRFSPDTESFGIILVNTRRVPIGMEVISNGTLDTVLVHAREVFKSAIILNAAAIILPLADQISK
jgi:DNA repair protein RadC